MRLNFENEDIYNGELGYVMNMYNSKSEYISKLEYNEDTKSLDLVSYDISKMIEIPYNAEEFDSIVSENLLDREDMEINRVVVVQGY